jgi:tRNA-dihydrouridine synthase
MAEAARMVCGNGARIIDINMGCPAKKVVGGLSGSALLRDLDHAMTLVEAVVGAVDVPVTLKTRLGWDDGCLNAADLARRAEAAGIQMITIHGRTRCQFYKGVADWSAIARVKAAVDIPVIANGDIVDDSTARSALAQSGADGVMIGARAPEIPQGVDFAAMVAGHYESTLSFYGEDLGNKVIRKHLGWYMGVAATPAALRREILTATAPTAVLSRLDAAFGCERLAA